MDALTALNVTTREEYWPNLITDLWGNQSPWMARIREKMVPWRGGKFIKSVFRFRPMAGFSHYSVGANHTNVDVDTLASGNFTLKFAQQPIVIFKEIVQVFNKGPEAVFSVLDEKMENGLDTITQGIAYNLYGDDITDPDSPAGLATFIGDGVLPQWNGLVSTSYGNVTRSDYAQGQMNANIFWGGTSTGELGDINFPLFERAYRKACRGNKHPDVILTNHLGFSAILNKMEPQFRYFEDTTDPYWGGDGYHFHGAYIMVDEFAPTTEGLSNDDNYGLGNYLTGTINPNPVTTTKNGFPVVGDAATLKVGEPYFFINTDEMIFRLDDDPEYGFGFSGFIGNQDSEKLVGRIKAAYCLQGLGSRYQSTIIGTGG